MSLDVFFFFTQSEDFQKLVPVVFLLQPITFITAVFHFIVLIFQDKFSNRSVEINHLSPRLTPIFVNG